jgi:hypothetical protein
MDAPAREVDAVDPIKGVRHSACHLRQRLRRGQGPVERPFAPLVFGGAARSWRMAHVRRTTHSRKTAARKGTKRASPKRWSQRVTKESDALDLKHGVFKLTSAKKIATSLKRSAQHSARRKTGAYRSALSMLTFYINRAGKTLPQTQRTRLERAKVELKRVFGRE